MTVIAWDGKIFAIDKQINHGSTKRPAHKCEKLNDGTIIAWSGAIDAGLILANWYKNGSIEKNFPFDVKDDALADLVVVKPDGECFAYCQSPHKLKYDSPFIAWGSGMEIAMAVMDLGHTAIEAVEMACKYNDGCGFGMDVFEVIK